MPQSCIAPGCTNRALKGNGVRFFRVPKDETRKTSWVNALRRKNWIPKENDRVCSAHFITGKPHLHSDHPDYVPSVFSFSPKPEFKKLKRYERLRNRKVEVLPETIPVLDVLSSYVYSETQGWDRRHILFFLQEMKDTSVKLLAPVPLLPPKSKLGIKKNKMAAKKGKEHKTPIMKVGKGKKASIAKKSKVNKNNPEPVVKRKRGRPRNEDRLHIKKPEKEPKTAKKFEDGKAAVRKRKSNADIKIEKEFVSPSVKKPKISDNNCKINGDIKLPIDALHKSFSLKNESSVADHSSTNMFTSNGTIHGKKPLIFGNKKSPLNILKSATFHPPPPKKELLNGNGSLSSFKFQPAKNKSVFKKDLEINSLPKSTETNSRNDNINCVFPHSVESKEAITNNFSKYQIKVPSFSYKEPIKTTTKESVKCHGKECTKSQVREPIKIQPSKFQLKEPIKVLAKVSSKPKEVAKSVVKSQPKDPKPIIPREPIKSHPQRMASLDALAKMHVICTTDRKPSEPKHTSVAVCPSRSFSHQKSITQCHERIQFDVKKETNEFKGNIVHKQEINFVKEKQQVFVSHSVQQSSIVQHEQSKTVSTKVQHEKEKKKKAKPLEKSPISTKKIAKKKVKQSPSNNMKLIERFPKLEKSKTKASKSKDGDKKNAKSQNKALSKVTKCVKEKPDVKSTCKKTKKVEQTKSEVKVKETIRMQKTCTYQSVTTVNSHSTANTSVVPVSHVGLTTNFSKTKKTVVTDEECKNKVNFSTGSVINNSYCLTTERPCSAGPHTECCKIHTHPQIIPVAHMQTCSFGHSLNRTSEPSSSSHCDGTFPLHRFGHQQPVLFTTPTPECGFCCSNSLMQNVHDSCLLRKSIVAYPRHLPSHHSHLSANTFSSETVCSDCHQHSNTALDTQRHHSPHFSVSSPTHSRVACCACCKLHHESNQHHHQSSLRFMSQPKTSSSLVPCEQSPLDLSLTSSASNMGIESDIALPQGHCSSPLCCRDLFLLRTSPHSFQHNKTCCKCKKQTLCETQAVDTVQSLSCSNNKSIIKIGHQAQAADHISLLASPVGQGSVPPVASTSGITNKSVPHNFLDDSLVTAKLEKSISPKQCKPSVVSKKHMFAHGWSWKGKPREKLIALTNDSVPCPRVCYPSVQHKEGDTISERDCVLLRSGPKDTDLPYVAKVAAFWENPDDGEMMMSLLWYYRPEHTDQGRKPGQREDEVFASRHKDVNSVACIEDKCYVLTYNEYCRYKANLSMDDDKISLSSIVVPELPEGYPRKNRLPCEPVSQDIVFFCRHVYDFRQKRILKNPT